MKKGGVLDVLSAARAVLEDWNSGRIPYYTVPPKDAASVHVGASIVSEWSAAFDMDAICESEKAQVLAPLPDATSSFMEVAAGQSGSLDPMYCAEGGGAAAGGAAAMADGKDDEDEEGFGMDLSRVERRKVGGKAAPKASAADELNLQRGAGAKKEAKQEKRNRRRSQANVAPMDGGEGEGDGYSFDRDYYGETADDMS